MVANTLHWTIRDLDTMLDDGGWIRHEIINGELFATRSPHICHQGAGGNIHFELELVQTKQLRPSISGSGCDFYSHGCGHS